MPPGPRATAARDGAGCSGPTVGAGAVNSAELQGRFARLITATPAAIASPPSPSMAECLWAAAFGLSAGRGRVATEALQSVGSPCLHQQRQAQGVEVALLPMRADGSIAPAEFDRPVTPLTTLVAVCNVSFLNGFEHEMAALCRLPHARGALVLADSIHSAGAMPVDVRGWWRPSSGPKARAQA